MSSNQVFFYGIVTDNQDPDKLGRVKVAVESAGADNETPLIPVLAAQAGKESGMFMLPDVDDQVFIAFLDPQHWHAVVLGGVWSPSSQPPKTDENSGSDLNADGENNPRFHRSRAGMVLIFDESDADRLDNSRISTAYGTHAGMTASISHS